MKDKHRNNFGRRTLLLTGFAAALMATSALAAPPVNTLGGGFFSSNGDTAILGYDPVAYFTEGRPVQGTDDFVHQWMGAKWKFASQEHLDRFKQDPARFAPQYGGYCAYGVAKDNLVGIEPDKFTIVDGKLYLNYNASIQEKWLLDPGGFIRTADAKFQALLDRK